MVTITLMCPQCKQPSISLEDEIDLFGTPVDTIECSSCGEWVNREYVLGWNDGVDYARFIAVILD